MNRKINILRGLFIGLLLMMFGIIFNFSNQNGDKSGSLSRHLTEDVTKNIGFIQKLEDSEKERVLKKIEHIIRNLAHFSLYFAVGTFSMGLLATFDLKNIKRFFGSLGIGVLYASLDEFHQFFIPDRSASVVDVFIDSFGVICGIGVVLGVIKVLEDKNNVKKLNLK